MKKNIGLAMLPIEHTELGTSLQVETPNGTITVAIVQVAKWRLRARTWCANFANRRLTPRA